MTADRDLTRSRGLLVTWLPARVSRSACRVERGGSLVENPSKTVVAVTPCSAAWTSASPSTTPCALTRREAAARQGAAQRRGRAARRCSAKLADHGRVLVIVDQPASIGALAIAVARALGIEVAYLPGLAMRRIADLHPGEAKTDARDAYVIADAARTMPHTLRRVGTDDETLAELDRARRLRRRPRRPVHPADQPAPRRPAARPPRAGTPARARDLDRGGVLDLLAAAPTPAALRDLGADGIAEMMQPRSPRLARTLPAKILAALDAQTVVVPGTAAFGRVIAGVAAQLRDVRTERATWPPSSRPAWRPTLLPRS